MKRISVIAILFAAVVATPIMGFAQQTGEGAINGKVLDRDGKPLQGAIVRIQNNATNQIDMATTNKTGSYSIAGLYVGRYKAQLIVDKQVVMGIGETQGDAIFVADGQATNVNFDMRKAPANAAPKAAIPAPGKPDKAKAEAEKKADSEMRAAFNAGIAAMKAQNWDEAVKQFQAAAEKDPSQAAIFGNLGMALLRTKKYDDSIEAFKKSIALSPTDAGVHGQLSLAYGESGKMDDAEKEVQEAAKLDPTQAGISYYNLGAVMLLRGKTKEAVDMFKKAVEADPKNAPSYYQLGIAYFGSTDTIPAAISALEKYLQLDPNGTNAESAKQLIAAAKATPH